MPRKRLRTLPDKRLCPLVHYQKKINEPKTFSSISEIDKATNEAESNHLEQLASVGVDLTQYLVNQQQLVPDEVLQVVTPSARNNF